MDRALAHLADAGFDLAHTFDPIQAAREPGWEHLATLTGRGRRGLLVGNTRALWPRFVAAMRDPALAAEADPLDRYTERVIATAFPGAHAEHAHRSYEGSFRPFQRLAVVTGFGALAPSQLVIHPIYGPWFALRAVVVLDGDPPSNAPIAQPCECQRGCRAAFEAALEATRGPTIGAQAEPGTWERWLAVRDACSLRAWRYPEEMIRYHYTKIWLPPVEDPDSP